MQQKNTLLSGLCSWDQDWLMLCCFVAQGAVEEIDELVELTFVVEKPAKNSKELVLKSEEPTDFVSLSHFVLFWFWRVVLRCGVSVLCRLSSATSICFAVLRSIDALVHPQVSALWTSTKCIANSKLGKTQKRVWEWVLLVSDLVWMSFWLQSTSWRGVHFNWAFRHKLQKKNSKLREIQNSFLFWSHTLESRGSGETQGWFALLQKAAALLHSRAQEKKALQGREQLIKEVWSVWLFQSDELFVKRRVSFVYFLWLLLFVLTYFCKQESYITFLGGRQKKGYRGTKLAKVREKKQQNQANKEKQVPIVVGLIWF